MANDSYVMEVRTSIDKLVANGFLAKPISENAFCGPRRFTNNHEATECVVGWEHLPESRETLLHFLESDPNKYFISAVGTVMNGEFSLPISEYLNRFVQNFESLNPRCEFMNDLQTSPNLDTYLRNMGASMQNWNLDRTDFGVMLGLYCAYRAEELYFCDLGFNGLITLNPE